MMTSSPLEADAFDVLLVDLLTCLADEAWTPAALLDIFLTNWGQTVTLYSPTLDCPASARLTFSIAGSAV